MEETLSMIIHGCRLARELESNLANLTGQPNALSSSCNEILRVFEMSANHLNDLMMNRTMSNSSSMATMTSSSPLLLPALPPQLHHHPIVDYGEFSLFEPHAVVAARTSVPDNNNIQEWLRSSYSQALEQVQGHEDTGHHSSVGHLLSSNSIINMVEDHAYYLQKQQQYESNIESDPRKGIPAVAAQRARARKRKDGADKRTVRVAGPVMGNLEIPPDDGFTWRKYGQKEILGSSFPRGYYRCTHKSFYGCEAKKQVQRLDDDPNTFEVTYYGHHSCCNSSETSNNTIPCSSSSTMVPPHPYISTSTYMHLGESSSSAMSADGNLLRMMMAMTGTSTYATSTTTTITN
ncbi:WRKY transcription factor 71-like [Papaver somniferum]|uniref:WRKY transcription factor 71-like n=1 Tax=Papaver somniferum TaxID=3469 RepID=UPI000E6F9C76|nr:WRKY transcription factor 71-like [Papaver somniferum]